jgi:hypothetical protein
MANDKDEEEMQTASSSEEGEDVRHLDARGGNEAKAETAGQKFWAVLLVLDAFFLVIFGSALALKIYQYGHPEAPFKPVLEKNYKVARIAAPITPSTPITSKANQPAASTQPHTLSSKEVTRETSVNSKAETSASTFSGKARPVTFSLHSTSAKRVRLVGAFIAGNGYKSMTKSSGGNWQIKLYLKPGSYRYYFLVNGKKTLDPHSPKIRGYSVLNLH